MISKNVCAKSDAKDVLAMSDATAKAILANFTTTITFAVPKTAEAYVPLKLTHSEYQSLIDVAAKPLKSELE